MGNDDQGRRELAERCQHIHDIVAVRREIRAEHLRFAEFSGSIPPCHLVLDPVADFVDRIEDDRLVGQHPRRLELGLERRPDLAELDQRGNLDLVRFHIVRAARLHLDQQRFRPGTNAAGLADLGLAEQQPCRPFGEAQLHLALLLR